MRDNPKAQCTDPRSSLNFRPPRLRCCRVPGCSLINKVAKKSGRMERGVDHNAGLLATTYHNHL